MRLLQASSASFPILVSALLAGAPATAQADANSSGPSKAVGAQRMSQWPTDLLLVGTEGSSNTVPMGTSSKDAVKWATFFSPYNDKLALRALKNTGSELGETSVAVEPFYMSRFAVTNEQYIRFVKSTGARFPFHWWKRGVPANFEAHRKKIHEAFPDLEAGDRINAPIYYWEDYWNSEKLEYAIPKAEEKHPVVFVSWRDALQYAAWAGMRMPTEIEWTYAANGGQRKIFVFGNDWNEQVLTSLKMDSFRDTHLKPVGSMGPLARGPFGHGDMVGQVWEWVIPLGFQPQTERKVFEKEYKKLRKNKKFGQSLPDALNFRNEYAVAKGGSFYSFSTKDFVQARINCRAPLDTKQTMEGLGFRVAKTQRPAYDMSISRLKSSYPPFLSEAKEPSYAAQIGWERYQLEGAGDIIANYEALSVVPMNYLSFAKNPRSRQIAATSQVRPIELAVVISTGDLVSPALKKGTYVTYLRQAGVTQELTDALSTAHKVLTAAARAKERAAREKAKAEKAGKKGVKKKKAPEKKKAPKKKTGAEKADEKWRQIVKRYGYSHEEILANGPKECAKYIYLRHTGIKKADKGKVPETFKISTESSLLLYRDQTGKWVAAVPTTQDFLKANSDDAPSTITEPVGGAVKVSFSIPIDQAQMIKKRSRRQMTFEIGLQMK
ncbi:MAG: SUMF1/EgtB/PvdO family nonheme iron enzyme [Planctomycetota bacterium]|nr:SUMF1/EgtB/PvdO family nonheme iron enzyme [Planctomycetota bacterium]